MEIRGQPADEVLDVAQRGRHILLHGPPGTGKTTTVKWVAEQISQSARFFNMSHCRGIYEVKDKILPATRNQTLDGADPVLILDEFEFLNSDAQRLFRGVMDKDRATFLLTSNDPQDINDAIRSRCVQWEFGPVGDATVVAVLEDQGVDHQTAERIAKQVDGDVRSALNEAQKV